MDKSKIIDLLVRYGVYHMTNMKNGDTIVDISPCALFEDDFEESLLLNIDKDGVITILTGEL